MGKSISANNLQELHSLTMMTCRPLPSYVQQPTQSVAPPRPPAVKGWVLAMLACGCAWLRSRFAPLTAVAAALFERCRLRRNAGLCLTRGMRETEAFKGSQLATRGQRFVVPHRTASYRNVS